jgi:hypothetical protein
MAERLILTDTTRPLRLAYDGSNVVDFIVTAMGALNIHVGGSVAFAITASQDLSILPTKKFYFDGVGNTYLHESAADKITAVAGGINAAEFDSDNTANQTRVLVAVGGGIGLTRVKVGADGTGPGGVGRALWVQY